jgi:hypothetical protein
MTKDSVTTNLRLLLLLTRNLSECWGVLRVGEVIGCQSDDGGALGQRTPEITLGNVT